MATGTTRRDVGCCCERFYGPDFDTDRPVVTRDRTHHCCPMHGEGRDVRTPAR